MIGRLEVIAGPDSGRSFALEPDQRLVVGRGPMTATRLSDPTVSMVHCSINVAGRRLCLTNIGGNSETLVNGRAISIHELACGDVIQIGRTTLRLVLAHVHDRAIAPRDGRRDDRAIERHERLADDSRDTSGPLTGQVVSHYKILSLLAPGQTEKVYKARDERNDRIVVFKALGQECSHRPECFHRFIRALRTVVGLQHENMVQVYAGAGNPQSLCWVAMEYIDGESLTKVIRRIGPANMLDWRSTLSIAVHLARVLDFAHKRHIIHGNITPANILVGKTDNVAKLSYMIRAKVSDAMPSRQGTQPGELLGDSRFMPPERSLGEEQLDARSDIYSLGATLYTMLAGRPPFQGRSHTDLANQTRYAEPVKPKKYQLAIWEPFQDIVMTMLAECPEDRFQTATDLLRQLDQVARFQGIKI